MNWAFAIVAYYFAVACGITACNKDTTFRSGAIHDPYAELDASAIHSREFSTMIPEQRVLAIANEYPVVVDLFRLTADSPTVGMMRQVERPFHQEHFTQGNPGSFARQSMPAHPDGKLDLLVVVDDSQSMQEPQTRLAAQLDPLLTNLGNSDWQIAVTKTSATPNGSGRYGCLRNSPSLGYGILLTRDQFRQDPVRAREEFKWKIEVGETGETSERGILASVAGLTGDCGIASRNWRRADAHTAVLMLSDEENCGSASNDGCAGAPDARESYFTDNAPADTKFNALLYDATQSPPCVFYGSEWRQPNTYWNLVSQTGGVWGNICESSFVTTLEVISANIRPGTQTRFALNFAPDSTSLVVDIDGTTLTSGYSIAGNIVTIAAPIADSAQMVNFSYTHDPAPMFSDVSVTAIQDAHSVVANINSVDLAATEFTVDPSGRRITFIAEPPVDAAIRISYREPDPPLVGWVQLDPTLLEAPISVTIDGKPTSCFSVNPDTSVLTLNPIPLDGSLIEYSHEQRNGRRTRYPYILAAGQPVEESVAFDVATGRQLAALFSENEVTFQWQDVTKNRLVRIETTYAPTSQEFDVALPGETITDSIELDGSSSNSECAAAVEINAAHLTFPCPARDLTEIEIHYEVTTPMLSSFTMPGRYSTSAMWLVFLNGDALKTFTVEGATVTIPPDLLTETDRVRIEVRDPENPAG